MIEPHREAGFFTRFADRRQGDLLTAIDIAPGKHPLAIARLDGALYEHDLAARHPDDRAHGDLRIEIKHETA
jgi:hypothetical protein